MKLFLTVLILGLFSSMHVIGQQQDLVIITLTLYDGAEPLWLLKNVKSDVDHPDFRDRIRILPFKKGSPILCEYVASDTSHFTGAKIIRLSKYPRPLLATNWTRGVRSPCLRIFDPTLGNKAFLAEYCSIDLRYEVKGDHLDITEFDYKPQDDATLIEMRTEWSPLEVPKVGPPDNP